MTSGSTDESAATFSRRNLLVGSSVAAAGLLAAGAAIAASASADGAQSESFPFRGAHQAGIATPAQDCLVFASFDVTTTSSAALRSMLASWTGAAERLTIGQPVAPPANPYEPPSDTGEATGIGPAGLTVTIGYGATLFDDRFGLAPRRPEALAPLPLFPGDDLDAASSGGDLCIQACANDAQVAFHAVHNLARIALGTASLRWMQSGFGRTSSTTSAQTTPRNLLGFKDGTNNLLADDPGEFDRYVWVGTESDQPWLRGGSVLVARRIRTHLESWAATPLESQQDVIGRFKGSGAPLTGTKEHDRLDLAARGPLGVPVIPLGAHVRNASPTMNDEQQILRRGYSFADGLDPRTGELDAGLFFICFQKDPALQFAKIQANLSINDSLRNYVTHTSSAVFACPPGLRPNERWGERLFLDT